MRALGDPVHFSSMVTDLCRGDGFRGFQNQKSSVAEDQDHHTSFKKTMRDRMCVAREASTLVHRWMCTDGLTGLAPLISNPTQVLVRCCRFKGFDSIRRRVTCELRFLDWASWGTPWLRIWLGRAMK